MLRAASHQVSRKVLTDSARRSVPNANSRLFHATTLREEETKTVAVAPSDASGFKWEPIYSVPLGLAFAVPALKYEWIVVNEEVQLAACFIAFTAIVYKQFGGAIYEALSAEGDRLIEEHNKVEDEVIHMLQDKIDDIKFQSRLVQDAEEIKQLKLQTYDMLNEAGKIKPLYDFKSQMERMLTIIQNEEANMTEKAKHSLMEEATAGVTSQFLSSADLKKRSLANAIASLKGTKASGDVVKDAYLQFFKSKTAEASKIDPKKESAEARAVMAQKMNAIAKSEGFFFEIGADGKPKMVV
ncbi:hypothetical protein MPSEU_001020600 [Mayamaea pseudoterrestris]|nr:hypothetical protein MPSEU_001020600 [Mayamaea pseudoterrestris]